MDAFAKSGTPLRGTLGSEAPLTLARTLSYLHHDLSFSMPILLIFLFLPAAQVSALQTVQRLSLLNPASHLPFIFHSHYSLINLLHS